MLVGNAFSLKHPSEPGLPHYFSRDGLSPCREGVSHPKTLLSGFVAWDNRYKSYQEAQTPTANVSM